MSLELDTNKDNIIDDGETIEMYNNFHCKECDCPECQCVKKRYVHIIDYDAIIDNLNDWD